MNLKEIEARLAAIKQEMNNDGADLEALSKEVDDLIEQRNKIIAANESRSALLQKIASGEVGTAADGAGNLNFEGAPSAEAEAESRAKQFAATGKMKIGAAESRSVLLSSGAIATPTKTSGINEGLTAVCSIIDMVHVEDCTGMGSETIAYVKAESEASEGVEGQKAAESDPDFDTVTITSKEYNLLSYVSKTIKKHSPQAYEEKVKQQAHRALRRKAAAIVTAAIAKSELKREVTDITKIDAGTLRKIVLTHGSDEVVEGNAVLYLNKNDLIAFGDIRGTNEKKAVYEITPDGANPNCGTIKDGGVTVKYCLNPYCAPLTGNTNESATETKPTMMYGNPLCAKLDLFGDYTVEVDEGYKFGEGLLSIRGTIDCGAELQVMNGFTVISLPKATG